MEGARFLLGLKAEVSTRYFRMNKIGIVAGSFDPITHGHVWLIKEACALMDQLYVVIGVNTAKKAYFTPEERLALVKATLEGKLPSASYNKVKVVFLENELLINYASEIGAEYIVRGIRNTEDFNYEYQMQLVNRKINQHVRMLYLFPPPQLTEVSSSTVKGLVAFKGWEAAVSRYVHPEVVAAFKEKKAAHPTEVA